MLYITNHFTHPVIEAQAASPRYHLARKLAERGQKILMYCPLGTHEGNPLHDFLANLRPRRFSQGNTTYLFPPLLVSPSSIVTVPTLIFATCFIILYLHLTRLKVSAQYCTTTLVASVGAVLRMRLKIPMVANYGDPDFARESGLARKAFRFCEDLVMSRRNARSVVYVDEVVGDYLRSNFPTTQIFFLPNGGYEVGFESPQPDSEMVLRLKRKLGLEAKPTILYAGQLTKVYRLDMLVASAPFIISNFPEVKFLMIGSGPSLADFKRSVRKAHLVAYFLFSGSVPYRDIGPYVVSSDVCVQLLNDWCMGTKVLMYMTHKKALVASGNWYDRYGFFLKNGENAILVPPDSTVLGKKIVELLGNPELRARLGESAWNTVQPYTWDMHADETLRLLREAMNSN